MTRVGEPGDDLAVLVARILAEPLDDAAGRRRRRPVIDSLDRKAGRVVLQAMRTAARYEAQAGEPRYWLHLRAERDALATNLVRAVVIGDHLPPDLLHAFAVLDRALAIRTAVIMAEIEGGTRTW
jgi:hypothetical protein